MCAPLTGLQAGCSAGCPGGCSGTQLKAGFFAVTKRQHPLITCHAPGAMLPGPRFRGLPLPPDSRTMPPGQHARHPPRALRLPFTQSHASLKGPPSPFPMPFAPPAKAASPFSCQDTGALPCPGAGSNPSAPRHSSFSAFSHCSHCPAPASPLHPNTTDCFP